MVKPKSNKKKYFKTVKCINLEDFLSKVKGKINLGWAFRGHQDASWELQHRFERACTRLNVFGRDRIEMEKNMIREFKRRLHHYIVNVPVLEADDEWLALMQHHGAPTRFLDFTYSPYVAAYFAFESAKANSNVAIWAINFEWLVEQLKDIGEVISKKFTTYRVSREKHVGYFSDIFMRREPTKLLLTVNPFRLNERLTSQRGVFLCPGDVSVSLKENFSVYKQSSELVQNIIRYKIPTGSDNEITIEALELLDAMNISRTTLFPGLDGFAQSLENRMKSLFERQKFA